MILSALSSTLVVHTIHSAIMLMHLGWSIITVLFLFAEKSWMGMMIRLHKRHMYFIMAVMMYVEKLWLAMMVWLYFQNDYMTMTGLYLEKMCMFLAMDYLIQ